MIARHAESQFCFVVKLSVEAIDVLLNQVGSHIVGRFWVGLKTAYSGNQLSCPCTLTHISVVCSTSAEVQGFTYSSTGSRDTDGLNDPTLSPLRPTSPLAKGSRSRTKSRDCR